MISWDKKVKIIELKALCIKLNVFYVGRALLGVNNSQLTQASDTFLGGNGVEWWERVERLELGGALGQ